MWRVTNGARRSVTHIPATVHGPLSRADVRADVSCGEKAPWVGLNVRFESYPPVCQSGFAKHRALGSKAQVGESILSTRLFFKAGVEIETMPNAGG